MEIEKLKSDMLALVGLIRLELEGLLEGLSPDQQAERGSLEQWSAKDMLVHLAFWEGHFNSQLQAGQKGNKVPQVGDYYEIINDGLFIRHVAVPFTEAQENEESLFQESLRLLQAMSADELCNPRRFAWLEGRSLLDRALGTFVWHVLIHISEIYRSCGQQKKALRLQETYTQKLCSFPVWNANAPYNLACFYAQNNYPLKAIRSLDIAFRLRPELMEWARQDADLDPLREMPDFLTLLDT